MPFQHLPWTCCCSLALKTACLWFDACWETSCWKYLALMLDTRSGSKGTSTFWALSPLLPLHLSSRLAASLIVLFALQSSSWSPQAQTTKEQSPLEKHSTVAPSRWWSALKFKFTCSYLHSLSPCWQASPLFTWTSLSFFRSHPLEIHSLSQHPWSQNCTCPVEMMNHGIPLVSWSLSSTVLFLQSVFL